MLKKLNILIELLTRVWCIWIMLHKVSNNVELTFAKRKLAGESCEKLQAIRQRLLIKIDETIEEIL